MTSYEKIYDESVGNYGLITSARASELGISNMTLVLLAGESVIALLNLVPTNPTYFYVAQPGRSRKVLPKEIVLRTAEPGYTPTFIQGIRCQQVGDAILSARGTVPPDRLVAAAREAYRTGHLDKEEMEIVIREMEAST